MSQTEAVVVALAFVQDKFHSFHPVATILSYLTKAPLVRNNCLTVVCSK